LDASSFPSPLLGRIDAPEAKSRYYVVPKMLTPFFVLAMSILASRRLGRCLRVIIPMLILG